MGKEPRDCVADQGGSYTNKRAETRDNSIKKWFLISLYNRERGGEKASSDSREYAMMMMMTTTTTTPTTTTKSARWFFFLHFGSLLHTRGSITSRMGEQIDDSGEKSRHMCRWVHRLGISTSRPSLSCVGKNSSCFSSSSFFNFPKEKEKR